MKDRLRILGIAPYPGLRALLETVGEQYEHLEIDACIGNMEGALHVAQTRFSSGYDVIVSRGGTADLLRRSGYPVIEIDISLYDVLSALRLADGIKEKTAMVVYADIASCAQMLCDMLGYQLEIFSADTLTDLMPILQDLRDRDYHTVLCDTIANGLAQRIGLNSVLITSGYESVRQALDQAEILFQSTRELRRRCRFYQTVLSRQTGQTFVLDEAGAVLFQNGSDASDELLTCLRQEVRELQRRPRQRIVRTIGGASLYIRVHQLPEDVPGSALFCIEPRRIPASADQTGIRFLSRQDAETIFYDSVVVFGGVISAYQHELERLGAGSAPVLISGEYGTGRQQIAIALHFRGPYANAPMVMIHCPTLNDKSWSFLMDSSSSPLTDTRTTIFLSDVDALPSVRRRQLIELLQTLRVCRSNQVILSCTCNSDRQTTPESLEFLNGCGCIPLQLTPMRKVPEQISTLVSLSLSHFNVDQVQPALGASPEAIRLLQEYSWPQNYTQFSRILQELAAHAAGQTISAHLVGRVLAKERYLGAFHAAPDENALQLDLTRPLAELDREIAMHVLREQGGNHTATAKRLGISRTTLWRLLRPEGSAAP